MGRNVSYALFCSDISAYVEVAAIMVNQTE